MAAATPLSTVVLAARSAADDLSFVALADLAEVLGEHPTEYRVIGGLMVSVLAARWGLGARLYRATLDADVGIRPAVARRPELVERLCELGYEQRAGDRFVRVVADLQASSPADREAAIDILVPAYTSRARHNRRVGEHLVVTEARGLATALRRPPLVLSLELTRLNDQRRDATLPFPDEASALALKSLAFDKRLKDTDAVDVWRCLEVLHVAGTDAAAFTQGEAARAAAVVRSMFQARHGQAMKALAAAQRLSERGADQRFTRIRALVERVLG